MKIYMTGIDHSLASVDVRGLFAFTSAEKQSFSRDLASREEFEGCILLNTCNRTELWVSCCDGFEPDLIDALCQFKGLDAHVYHSNFACRSGDEAIAYLFEMTSGLRSRIIGEDQILAQVKKALDDARGLETCGSILDVLFRSAITGAKQVKTRLSLSTANASAVEYAIDHMSAGGMDFSGKKCLVIGNGEMGKRTAAALLALGADVTVTIRQYHSGIVEVVPGCSRINYTDRYRILSECDIVVSATSSPNMTLTYEALSGSKFRPGVVFIDLAVPRDIDPAIAQMHGVTLLDIDSFSVPKTEELQAQLNAAKELLEEQQKKFKAWFECRDLLPELDSLGAAFAEAMLYRASVSLREMNLSEGQREILNDALTEAADRVLKRLVFALRDEAGIETFRDCLAVFSGVLNHE